VIGTCNVISNTTFECLCQLGWTGEQCELITNYCKDISCQNYGVCQSLFLNYTCECLSDSFTGEYCENDNTNRITYQIISKSFAYICILFLVATAVYIVIMDVLKYVFHIDLTKKKSKYRPVIQKFIYIIDATHLEQLQRNHSMSSTYSCCSCSPPCSLPLCKQQEQQQQR